MPTEIEKDDESGLRTASQRMTRAYNLLRRSMEEFPETAWAWREWLEEADAADDELAAVLLASEGSNQTATANTAQMNPARDRLAAIHAKVGDVSEQELNELFGSNQ
jgi:hypothetical protein